MLKINHELSYTAISQVLLKLMLIASLVSALIAATQTERPDLFVSLC